MYLREHGRKVGNDGKVIIILERVGRGWHRASHHYRSKSLQFREGSHHGAAGANVGMGSCCRAYTVMVYGQRTASTVCQRARVPVAHSRQLM